MGRKIFQPEKYGMVVSPKCKGKGYIPRSKRQCCPKCLGFGFVRKEAEKTQTSPPKND